MHHLSTEWTWASVQQVEWSGGERVLEVADQPVELQQSADGIRWFSPLTYQSYLLIRRGQIRLGPTLRRHGVVFYSHPASWLSLGRRRVGRELSYTKSYFTPGVHVSQKTSCSRIAPLVRRLEAVCDFDQWQRAAANQDPAHV
uniref:Uncharacterized protein n=1 Tax=Peronospora matthiolae TaxID=2874970 RepID=A0AAV1UQ95_9STRA